MDIGKHYKDNYKHLTAVARRSVTDNVEYTACECVNQAYTNLMSYIESGGDVNEETITAYLFRILFNAIHDSNEMELKRGMTGRRDDEMFYATESVETIPIEGEITLDTHRQMCLNVVLGKFNRLSSRNNTVLTLYFTQGYNHSQIAATTGLSEKTSRNIVYNALKQLRDAL